MDPYGIFNIQDYWGILNDLWKVKMFIEKAICKLGFDEEILARTPKATSMKEKIDKLNFIKI